MLITMTEQKNIFDRHINHLASIACPGRPKAELIFEFMNEAGFQNEIEDNYFYEFTMAFEMFLYFKYRVSEKFFKYFNLDRFYA